MNIPCNFWSWTYIINWSTVFEGRMAQTDNFQFVSLQWPEIPKVAVRLRFPGSLL